jgi:hypothetical protein
MKGLPEDRKSRVCLGLLALLALYGALMGGMQASDWVQDQLVRMAIRAPVEVRMPSTGLPVSKLPGPPREALSEHILNAKNAARMVGQDVVDGERWSDIAGNHYGDSFSKAFSYANTDADGPQVWVRIEPTGETLRGRLEARKLKPFFAYQIKLMGDYSKGLQQFEAIGYLGRWRLPGDGTNFSDGDYEGYADKAKVRAYLLFDFFVTDAKGNAIREFALDSSLHVLWVDRQRSDFMAGDAIAVEVLPADPNVYTNPKPTPTIESVWAEREHGRYTSEDQLTRLPVGIYEAKLVLTEETFHTIDRDGGYWPTVLELPIRFEIIPESVP